MQFLIALVIIIIFLLYAGALFFPTMIQLAINLPILAIILLRAKGDILVDYRGIDYIVSFILAAIIYFSTKGFFDQLPFWELTSYLLLGFLIAQFAIYTHIKEQIREQLKQRKR